MMTGEKKRMKKMNGKDNFKVIYDLQTKFQEMITGKTNLPQDSIADFSYHIQAIVEELGEVMKSDKRWKNYRNQQYDPQNKLEEICDVYITLLNVAIFSGFTSEELVKNIFDKIEKNNERFKKIK